MLQDRMPPIGFIASRPAWRKPYWDEYLVRFDNGQWHFRKIFVIGIVPMYAQLSHDKRWYYISSLRDGILLGRVGQPKMRKVDSRLLNARFSPNNRYLLGTHHFGGGLVLFDLQRGTKRELVPQIETGELSYYFYHFGWYPDSRYIWYSVPSKYVDPDYVEPFYQIDILTGRRRRLSAQEAQALRASWGVIEKRYAEFPWSWYEESRWVYSRDRQVRLRVVGPLWQRDPQPGSHKLVLEWRNERSEVLLERGDHNWTDIEPIDVTSNGRWALCVAYYSWNDPVVIIVDARTKRVELSFSEAPGVPYIHWNELWFEEVEK